MPYRLICGLVEPVVLSGGAGEELDPIPGLGNGAAIRNRSYTCPWHSCKQRRPHCLRRMRGWQGLLAKDTHRDSCIPRGHSAVESEGGCGVLSDPKVDVGHARWKTGVCRQHPDALYCPHRLEEIDHLLLRYPWRHAAVQAHKPCPGSQVSHDITLVAVHHNQCGIRTTIRQTDRTMMLLCRDGPLDDTPEEPTCGGALPP